MKIAITKDQREKAEGVIASLITTVRTVGNGLVTKMFRKMIGVIFLVAVSSVVYAGPKIFIDTWSPFTKNSPVYSHSGLGTREAEEAYHASVAAWMDATGGKQGVEPGAISYENGPIPINTAFNDQ